MKAALVTGGSRGIGKSIAKKLAGMGYHILINFVANFDAAKQTLVEIEAAGGSGTVLQFDVRNKEDVEKKLEGFKSQNPDSNIKVLVNNAGIRKDNLMVWMNESDWKDIIDIHLSGFYNVTQPLLKDFISNRWGRIINIVSLSGLSGMAGQANYSAAKAGVIGATKALAQEIGRKNITVNAIAPGFIRTEMTGDIDEKEMSKRIPLRRFGNPEEVAAVAGFLASDEAAYITGEVISVNGGLYM